MICFVDYRITLEELNSLNKLNLNVIKIPKNPKLYNAIDGHTDIQLNIISKKEKKIIINKDICETFKKTLNNYNIEFIESSSCLKRDYPLNIVLNAYISDNYLIHNLKYTDDKILTSCKGRTFIDIKQGYSKCSILPVRENSLITNDTGIYNTLKDYNFDILLLPFGDIILPGLNYGFIGGVGGLISDDVMAFFGSLDNYCFGEKIKDFLYKYDIAPYYLSNTKLMDRGSLFVL